MSSIHFISYPELVPYNEALSLQYELQKKRQEGVISDTVLLLEHPPTITLGRRSSKADLHTPHNELDLRGIEVVEIDRGGEITAHGPGQLTAYPILDLRDHGQDLHKYLRDLEEVLITTLASLGISAGVKEGLTGVWVADKKIAAIGVKVAKWVSMHGAALNILNDLTTFRTDFVPCGITQYGVTSVAELMPGANITRMDVEGPFISAFNSIFDTIPENHKGVEGIISR